MPDTLECDQRDPGHIRTNSRSVSTGCPTKPLSTGFLCSLLATVTHDSLASFARQCDAFTFQLVKKVQDIWQQWLSLYQNTQNFCQYASLASVRRPLEVTANLIE